jgi:hypothetical protein
MLYAITIEPLNTIVFVAERPEDNPWGVQEGVALDAAPLYGTWTADRGSLEEILCVSISEPKYFKVFRDQRDVDLAQFRPTGRHYGGIFSKPTWERFAKLAATGLATLDIGTNEHEPVRTPEDAVALIPQGG